MRRPFHAIAAIALVTAVPLAAASHVQAQASHVIEVVKLEGPIDSPTAAFLRARIGQAPAGGLIVVQLDSPGVIRVDPGQLARSVRDARVPVVVWAGPGGALVQGGAVLVFEGAAVAATSPGSGIGPGRPLDLAVQPTAESPAAVTAAADLAASLASQRGRSAEGARALVTDPRTILTAQDALDLRVADVAAASIPDLLARIDGRTVTTAAGQVRLVTQGAAGDLEVRFSQLGPVARILHAAANPTASYLLLVLGLWALVFELVQPGFGLAGVAGVVLLGLGIYSLVVLPASALGLGLLVGGIAAMTLDVVLRRLGVLTVGGAALFGWGSFLLYGKVADAIDVSPWLIGVAIVASLLYFGFALTAAVRARERGVASARSALIGLVGEAASDLTPEGQIVVKGAMWQGRALGDPIPGGSRVRVRAVDGLVLEVTVEPSARA